MINNNHRGLYGFSQVDGQLLNAVHIHHTYTYTYVELINYKTHIQDIR